MTEFVRALPPRPRRVLLTGVTGFVGQAVLERFLREEAVIHAVVRPRGDASGADRLNELLGKSAFDTWRAEVGPAGVARACTRLHAVEADLGDELPELPADLDLVVHSASTVSFDEPWDHAVRANVLGPAHLYGALLASGAGPHVIHVSTSYVGTDRVDRSLEGPVEHDADWRTEVEAAVSARAECEAATGVRSDGGETPDARMRARGRDRARELGWTDVYTMTKSLGERVAEELWASAGRRLTVLRPTIIESAVARPYPGWIDGFKVADPLIAAFAKGRLVAFPGYADAVLDIVPVDVVVDAAMAAAAVGHDEPGARYFQVGTGVSNPITMQTFSEHVEAAVHAEPWSDRVGRPIVPRPWQFFTPDKLDSWVGRRVAVLGALATGLRLLPARWGRMTRRRVDSTARALALLRSYCDIYQPYSCSHTVYDDTHTRELFARAAELGLGGALDVTAIDWHHYIREIHVPSLRALAEAHRRRPAAAARPAELLPSGTEAGTGATVLPAEQTPITPGGRGTRTCGTVVGLHV